MHAARHAPSPSGTSLRGRLFRVPLPCLLLVWALCVPRAQAQDDILFLHYWTGALSGGVDQLVQAYNRLEPPVRVVARGMEHESFKSGIKGLLASGKAPDIFSYWAGSRVRSLVEQGRLLPLDGVWNASEMESLFTPAVSRACTYGGRKYAVPVTQHMVGFFYNKRLFARLGLTPPADWADFLAVCDRLKEAGVAPLALGNRDLWPAQFWFDYLLARTAGHEFSQRLVTGGESFASPQVRQAFQLWRELLENGYFHPGQEGMDWSEAAGLVKNDQAAMTLMGTWIIGLYNDKLHWKEGEDFDFFVFPRIDPAVSQAAIGPIDVLVAPAGTRAKGLDQALNYFASVEAQMAMSAGSGALAPNRHVPVSFYSPLKRRILSAAHSAPHWVFPFDLAAPPPVADLGLGGFAKFLRHPDQLDDILLGVRDRMRAAFDAPDQPAAR